MKVLVYTAIFDDYDLLMDALIYKEIMYLIWVQLYLP